MPLFRRRSQGPTNWRLAQLWLPLYCTGALLVVATMVGGLVNGVPGATGGFAGVGVVMASYTVSMVVIAWADEMKSSWVLPVGLLTYVVKFTLIGVILAAAASAGWRGLEAMGFGVLVGVATWIAAQIVALNRSTRSADSATPEAGVPSAEKEE